MPVNKKPKMIIFRENYHTYLDENNVTESDFQDWPVIIKYCKNFKELSGYLKSGVDIVAISSVFVKKHSSLSEFMLMMDTLFKFNDIDSWGDNGYFLMPFEYAKKYVWDSWFFDIKLIQFMVKFQIDFRSKMLYNNVQALAYTYTHREVYYDNQRL